MIESDSINFMTQENLDEIDQLLEAYAKAITQLRHQQEINATTIKTL